MNEQQIIDSAIEYIEALFADDCGGHDAQHSMRVYRNASLIADTEPDCDRFIVLLAALLHGADDHKLFHTENNENARIFLEMNTAEGKRLAQARHSLMEQFLKELEKEEAVSK